MSLYRRFAYALAMPGVGASGTIAYPASRRTVLNILRAKNRSQRRPYTVLAQEHPNLRRRRKSRHRGRRADLDGKFPQGPRLARAQDTSCSQPILQLSRHGMLLRFIRGPSRLLANRLMEERVCLRGAEGIASKIAEQVGVSTTWAKRAADCLSKGGFIRRRDRNCSEKNRLWTRGVETGQYPTGGTGGIRPLVLTD
jgi:hypothetical protein